MLSICTGNNQLDFGLTLILRTLQFLRIFATVSNEHRQRLQKISQWYWCPFLWPCQVVLECEFTVTFVWLATKISWN